MSHPYEMHFLPPVLQDLVDRELEPDENLLWVGQPVPAFFVGLSFIPFLMGGPFTAFAIFWMGGAIGMGAPLLFALFGLPFVLAGLAMLCSPLFLRRILKNTVYVITDQRAVILVKSFFSTEIVSHWPDDLEELRRKEKANGTGDVLFEGSSLNAQHTPGKIPTNGFFNIPEAREVERLLRNLAAQAAKEKEQEPQTIDQLDDPPILLSIGYPPRGLPLSVRLYLRMCSTLLPLFGWFFAGFGFMFALIVVSAKTPEQDLMGVLVFVAFGSLFGVVGLCFPIYSWLTGGKVIRLLQDGIATKAKFLSVNPTNMRVNHRPVMKVDFEYQVDGETYTVSAQALDVSRLTDTKVKVVLYDPMQPGRSVVLDGLPQGIHLDELTGRFWVNPLRCVIPLLAAAIVGGEIIAILVMLILAI